MHQLFLPIFNQLSPLFFPLIALIGIISARVYSGSFLVVACAFCALISLLAIAAKITTKPTKQLLYTTAIICLFGWIRTDMLLNYYARFPYDQTSSPCQIKGLVINSSYSPAARIKHSVSIALETINDISLPSYTVQLYTLKQPTILVGDTVCVNNITIKAIKNSDFQWYLIKEGIAGSSFTDKAIFTLEK